MQPSLAVCCLRATQYPSRREFYLMHILLGYHSVKCKIIWHKKKSCMTVINYTCYNSTSPILMSLPPFHHATHCQLFKLLLLYVLFYIICSHSRASPPSVSVLIFFSFCLSRALLHLVLSFVMSFSVMRSRERLSTFITRKSFTWGRRSRSRGCTAWYRCCPWTPSYNPGSVALNPLGMRRGNTWRRWVISSGGSVRVFWNSRWLWHCHIVGIIRIWIS